MSDLFKPVPEEDRRWYFGPIDSPENWWLTVDGWWDELVAIIAHHMQLDSPAYENPGNAESTPTGRTIKEEILHLKETRDPKLVRYFSAAWFMASDAYAHSVPGWGRLCDLCSEDWVLMEEPPDDEYFVPCVKCNTLVPRAMEKCPECNTATGWPQDPEKSGKTDP